MVVMTSPRAFSQASNLHLGIAKGSLIHGNRLANHLVSAGGGRAGVMDNVVVGKEPFDRVEVSMGVGSLSANQSRYRPRAEGLEGRRLDPRR